MAFPKAALQRRLEGSAGEEATESSPFEKKEDSKKKKGAMPPGLAAMMAARGSK